MKDKPVKKVIPGMPVKRAKPVITDSGKDGSYYDITITNWTHERHELASKSRTNPGIQLCLNDIIKVLGMTYAEGNVMKAVWREAASRQGNVKRGHNSVYDAEKCCFYANDVLEAAVIRMDGMDAVIARMNGSDESDTGAKGK